MAFMKAISHALPTEIGNTVTLSLADAKPMFLMYKESADKANKIHANYVLATSGKDEAAASFLATSEDPKVIKFREYESQVSEAIAKMTADLEAAKESVKAYALENVQTDTDIDPKAAQDAFLEARKDAHAKAKALVAFVGQDLYDQGVEQYGITEVQSLKRGGKTTGATGVRRPRVLSATVNGTEVDKPTFGNLAKATNVSLDDFRTAAFAAAGTDNIMSLPEGTVVNFDVTDKDAKTYAISFVPKSTGADSDDNDSDESDDNDTED